MKTKLKTKDGRSIIPNETQDEMSGCVETMKNFDTHAMIVGIGRNPSRLIDYLIGTFSSMENFNISIIENAQNEARNIIVVEETSELPIELVNIANNFKNGIINLMEDL